MHFLALEPELLARLREQLGMQMPDLHLLSAADLAGVTEERQLSPAVHVIYRGYRVLEVNSSRRSSRIEQTWLAVVATRNARAIKSGSEARADAGELAAKVVSALSGWQPPSGAKPLALATGPAAVFSAGHQYLPLAFTAELVVGQARMQS